MPSLIPGFKYDVFISYRHKDNSYDGWVSEFVENLRKELSATVKGSASIYFDENPSDGLLETDDVDESLRDKIRSVVFIPIVSRTYCDTESFAWKHEFIAFRQQAENDKLGLKIANQRGNVTSRILPVRIHDLDPEDISLFESNSGGKLRPIDFIYKSKGVNRPLRAHEDEPKENQNHTYYRDQINKVAIAISDILSTARQPSESVRSAAETSNSERTTEQRGKNKWLVPSAIGLVVILLLAAGFFVSREQIKTEEPAQSIADPSIAVLPFADLSENKDQEYFSDGLSEELLNVLSKVPNLKVISRTSAFSFKGKNEDVRAIGEKLGVSYILEGSVRRVAEKVRITAQLIKVSDGIHLWSETFDRNMTDIFQVQDEISSAVAEQLKIKLLGHVTTPRASNPAVYNIWLKARYTWTQTMSTKDGEKALRLIQQGLAIDSTDARLWSLQSVIRVSNWGGAATNEVAEFSKRAAYEAAENALRFDPNLADSQTAMGQTLLFDWNLVDAEKYFRKSLELDPQSARGCIQLGELLNNLGRLDEAKVLFEKSIVLDPVRAGGHYFLGNALAYEEKWEEAREEYKIALSLSERNNYYLYLSLVDLKLGKTEEAKECVAKMNDDFWKSMLNVVVTWTSGNKEEAATMLKNFETSYHESASFQAAEIHGWIGNEDKVFEWLERAYDTHDPGITEMKNSILLKAYSDDPRFKAILKRLKLPA